MKLEEKSKDLYRDVRIIMFARDLHEKFPHINGVYQKDAYESAKKKYAHNLVLKGLMSDGIISSNTVNKLDDILNRMDRNKYERPTLLANVGKKIKQIGKKKGKYSESVFIREEHMYDDALKQQRSLRVSGNAPPLTKILETSYNTKMEEIETAVMLTLHAYLEKHPSILKEARDKLEPLLCMQKIKRQFKDKKSKKNILKGALIAGLLYGVAMVWMPEGKTPKTRYKNMNKYYQSIFAGIKMRDKEDTELNLAQKQIEKTYKCINSTINSGNAQQKKEAEELKKKLDRIKANLDIAKDIPQEEIMMMSATEIKKLLGGN